VIAITLLLATIAGPARADVPDYRDLLIDQPDNFILEEEARAQPLVTEDNPAFGPGGRAFKQSGVGEGYLRVYASYRHHVLFEVTVRDFKLASLARQHVMRGESSDWQVKDDDGHLSVEYDIPGPSEDHVGRERRTAIGRLTILVSVIVDGSAPSVDNAEKLRDDTLATIANRQQEQIPALPDVEGLAWGIPFDPPGAVHWSQWWARTLQPSVLALGYVLLWTGNGLARQRLWQLSRLRGWQRSVASRFSLVGWLYAGRAARQLEELALRVRSVEQPAEAIRRRSRRVALFGAAGFILAVALTWSQGTAVSVVSMLAGSMAGVTVGRWLWMSGQVDQRRSYSSSVREVGPAWWLGGLLLSAMLLGVATFLLSGAGSAFWAGGGPTAEMTATLRRLLFWQLLGGLGILGLVPLCYRFLQARTRRQQKAIADRDNRPPVLYLRSFADDQLTLRARRTARHHLFEYASPGARERFDEIVAWSLWTTGPVVAIGEPGSSVSPLGPAKEYYSDDHWRDAVAYYSVLAPVVAAAAGTSSGVEWELQHLMLSGALHRTMILIPPGRPMEREPRLALIDRVLDLGFSDQERRLLSLAPVLAMVVDPDGTPTFYYGRNGNDLEVQAAVELAAQRCQANTTVTQRALPPPPPASSNPPRKLERSTWKPAVALAGALWVSFSFVEGGVSTPWGNEEDLPAPRTEWEIPTCDLPVEIDAGNEGNWYLAACPALETVSATDRDANRDTIKLGAFVTAPTVLDGGRAVVADRQRPVLYELDLDPLRVRDTHERFSAPIADVAVTGDHLVATHPELGEVSILDSDTLKLRETVSIGDSPWGAAAHADAVYISDVGEDAVYIWGDTQAAPRPLQDGIRGIAGLYPTSEGVWAVNRLDARLYKIGTDGIDLTVSTPPDPLDVVASGDTLVVSLIDRVIGLARTGEQQWEFPSPGVPSLADVPGEVTAIGEHRRGTMTFVDVTDTQGSK
jgi:hypothetical protein